LLDFVMSAVLSLREWIEFRLRDNYFLVRPAHGDELADKWHLQLALRFSRLFRVRMFGKPMRKGVKQTEVLVHVLVFDECSAHDDLRNQIQRDDVGSSHRYGYQLRDNQTQRHTTNS